MYLVVVAKCLWMFVQFGLSIIQNVMVWDLTKSKNLKRKTRHKGG